MKMPNLETEKLTTPKKIKRVQGLITLSSNKKVLPRSSKNVSIDIDLDYGLVKRESFAKFAINVFQYILYDNDILPVPFQNFQRLFNNTQQIQNGDLFFKHQKILHELFSVLDFIFDFIEDLLTNSTFDISDVAICLGDSVAFSKKIYVLNLSKLNLCSRVKKYKMPYLPLRYLINTFYKRLLNEIDFENNPTTQSRMKKTKNIMFLAKISTQNSSNLNCFADDYVKRKHMEQKIEGFSKFRFELTPYKLYRLGCAITRITTFNFLHPKIEDLEKPECKFDIYIDNDIEEVIEECIESTMLCFDSYKVSSDDNDYSEQLDKFEQQQTEANLIVCDKLSDYIWIQIGTPVNCLLKL